MSFIPIQSATPILAARREAMTWGGSLAIALTAVLIALPIEGLMPGAVALGLFLAISVIVNRTLHHHPHARFGLANGLTLSRAAGAAALTALAIAPATLATDAALWFAAAGSAALLLMDGLDGRAARAQGLASDFGARFDMEVDAVTILVLTFLAFALGKAGAWIIAAGLMRYLFVLATMVLPALARPLPPSFRRKAVCVCQLVTLTLLLTPVLTPPLSPALAACALAVLVWSFAVDLLWLIRRR